MMKRIVAALAGLLALALPSAALAQCSGIFTSGYFCGNSTAGGTLAGAASPTAMFDRAFGGTNNSTVVRLSGVWTVLSSANSGVWITSAAGVPSISSTLPNAVQDNITRLGTIANVGAPIGATFGGTGQSSWAQGDILYASAVNTLAKLAAVATGNALISGTTPSWGKIALTTHVSGQLPLANGGCNGTTAATCLNNIMPTPTRAGDVAYWNGSAWTTLAGNNSGTNVLTENASGVPSWAAPGAGTVTSAVIAGTAGSIAVSGTCTITTTGTCTLDLAAARKTLPTTQIFTSGTDLTYTTPANTLYIEVMLVPGGAGGGGSGTSGGNGGAGNPTCWKASGTACTSPLSSATGGVGGGGSSGAPGSGGTVTGNCNMGSYDGAGGQGADGTVGQIAGGVGGGTFAGAGGGGGAPGTAGAAGAAHSGAGGGGAASNTVGQAGSGGGGGGVCKFRINSPAASYVYTCGASGAAGIAGTSGTAGGVGGSCYLVVDEHFN